MGFMKVYTGEVIADQYPNSLAHSVHFAYSADGIVFQPLNQGYGILFARAEIRQDNTLAERSVLEPRLHRGNDEYIITAVTVYAEETRTKENRSKENRSKENRAGEEGRTDGDEIVLWRTKDFVTFSEQEPVSCEKLRREFADGGCRTTESTGGHGAEILEIPDGLWENIRNRWLPLESVRVEYPPEVEIREWADLDKLTVRVIYSDGSADEKKVTWDIENRININNGCYKISGTIEPQTTGFPLAVGYADPVFFSWQGSRYFLATNDNENDVGLYIRRADTVEGLFAEGVGEACILDYDQEKGFCQTFWAPEAHVIGGELYILFAVSGEQWGPQCHMMRLKKGGQPMRASDWEEPVRVRRADGSPLAQDGITLDMTYFRAGDRSYVCWSFRHGIGTPKDSGSMLYLATVEEDCPWVLTSEPVLISRPLYGWENNSGTINNEGPYALILEDRIYLAYSGGDACGYYYAVGYLTASVGDDLLDAGNWIKLPAPVFCSASVEGIQGPGHNSFFRNEEGKLMIAYHAQEREKYFKRCTAYHRVHVSKSGLPMLNVVGERDVAEKLRRVEIRVRPYLDAKR